VYYPVLNSFVPAVTLKKKMKKQLITPGTKMASLIIYIVCLVSINKAMAQPNADFRPDKVLKPLHKIESKRKAPLNIGLGAELYASGNAHGAFYSAGVNLSRGKSIYSIGPCLQKRTLEFTGIKLGYSYLLSGTNDRYDADELKEMRGGREDIIELRLLCYVQYLHKARLSYNASRVETITITNTNAESNINFNEVRLSTIEGAVCAELDINLKWFKLRNYMGGTVFYHTRYINGMYREKCSPALIFGTGIIIPHF